MKVCLATGEKRILSVADSILHLLQNDGLGAGRDVRVNGWKGVKRDGCSSYMDW